jgi:DNA-binding response OmpR family regulator
VCRRLRSRQVTLPILMLTARHELPAATATASSR